MVAFHNILAVTQPRTDDLIALKKSVLLAMSSGSNLTFLSLKNKTSALKEWVNKSCFNNEVADNNEQVMSLVNLAKQKGIAINYIAISDSNHLGGIVTQLKQSHYDLVVLEHLNLENRLWPFDENEYSYVLQAVNCPTLFVGSQYWSEGGHVLAAIETEEVHIVHQELNNMILDTSSRLASLLVNDVHFLNCYQNSCHITFEENEGNVRKSVYENHLLHLKQIAKPYLKNNEQIHIEEGLVDNVIPEQAGKLDVNVVVMGSHEHKGLSSILSGHAIDPILNNIPCDLLAIKPRVCH